MMETIKPNTQLINRLTDGLIVLLFLLTGFYLWQIITVSVIFNDVGVFAEMTRTLIQPDRLLYVDFWDHKPPGLFFFTAPFMLIFGATPLAVQLAGIAQMFLMAFACMGLSQWLSPQRRVHIAVFAVALFYSALIVTTRGIETTLLMASFGTISLVLATRSSGLWGWFFAGFCFSLAFISKPPIATQFPALCLAILIYAPPRKKIIALIMLGIGAGIAIGLVALWGLQQGNLSAIWERAILSNVGYATGTGDASTYTPELTYLFRESLPMLLPLSLLSLLACWQLWRDSHRQVVIVWGAWAIMALVGSLAGQALKITYFLQLLPAVVVMSAVLISQQKLAYRIAYIIGLIVVIIAPKPYLDGMNAYVEIMHDPDAPLIQAAQYLKANTEPDDCLWLWGHLSGLSYHTERNSCTGVSQDAFVANSWAFDVEAYRPELLLDLLENRPAYLINNSAWSFFPMLQRYADRYVREGIREVPLATNRVDMSSYQATNIRFGDLFTLIGVDHMQSTTVCAGDTIAYATTWQVHQPPQIYYQMFVQLRDSDNQRVLGLDIPPSDEFPTQSWQKDAIILGDTFQLIIPVDIAEGQYQIALGFYNPEDLTAIPVTLADGTTQNEIIIEALQIETCQN